jgi:hypothetical protein
MKSRIGPPVTGDDYFPRPAVVQRLLRALKRGNVSFLGPRRTGKTSILKALHAHPPSGTVGVFINLEKHHTVADWLEEMIAKTRLLIEEPSSTRPWGKGVTKAFTRFLKRIESLNVGGVGIQLAPAAAKNWRPIADAFLELLAHSEVPILYLLDEFPWFLDLVAKQSSPAEAAAVLAWFRHARLELADQPARFLVTGSIGLDGLVRRLGLSPTINDFDPIEIPPLKEVDALEFLERLAHDEEVRLSEKGRRTILRLLGTNWPILLQLFVSEIQEWQTDEDRKRAPTDAELRRIYQDCLVNGNRNKYCSEMWDRIPKVFATSEARLAREILKELRLLPAGLTGQEIEMIHARLVPDAEHRAHVAPELDYVLDTLRHDGYVVRTAENERRTRFASNILRDYWIHRSA